MAVVQRFMKLYLWWLLRIKTVVEVVVKSLLLFLILSSSLALAEPKASLIHPHIKTYYNKVKKTYRSCLRKLEKRYKKTFPNPDCKQNCYLKNLFYDFDRGGQKSNNGYLETIAAIEIQCGDNPIHPQLGKNSLLFRSKNAYSDFMVIDAKANITNLELKIPVYMCSSFSCSDWARKRFHAFANKAITRDVRHAQDGHMMVIMTSCLDPASIRTLQKAKSIRLREQNSLGRIVFSSSIPCLWPKLQLR